MLPTRKSPRAKWIEYGEGSYHIVICTKDKRCYFGHIANFKMILNEIGEFTHFELSNPGIHHPNIEVPVFQIMPNHIHAIVAIKNKNQDTQTETQQYIQSNPPHIERGRRPNRINPMLSRYITALKSAITRYAKAKNTEFAWHSRYYDHMIRGVTDGNNIENYIRNNVINWHMDKYYEEKSPKKL